MVGKFPILPMKPVLPSHAYAPASTAAAPASHFRLPGRLPGLGADTADVLRPIWFLGGAYLAASMLLRVLLWSLFGLPSGVSVIQLPAVLLLGLLNDAAEGVYLFAPLVLYLLLVPARYHAGIWGRRLLAAMMLVVLFGILFICSLEYFFFEEFDSRFNLVAVDYLIYPTEVIGGIEAEYPVLTLSAGLLAAALAILRAGWRVAAPRLIQAHGSLRRNGPLLGAYAGLVLLVTAGWSAEAIAPFENRVANELTANGPGRFFAAFRTNKLDYPSFYRTGDSLEMRKLLAANLAGGGGQFIDLPAGDLTRRFAPRREGLGKLNVVLLSEESLGAEFVGAYGDRRGLTPEFDALASKGLLFTSAYATGTRTVRGLEAFSASFPPIPSESILKRPGNEDIATWGKVMRQLGYHTSFLYGGFGAFDNMNYYFGRNGFALSDRSDIVNPEFANVWGVSDGDLFTHALEYFDARSADGKPFFSIVMSTSNHKPYTFPAGIAGVKAEGGGREAGIRYADHAIGEFMRAASTRKWFKDTIFVIAADHGARVYGKAEIPLYSYEIPLLIYSPAHVQPSEMRGRTSQIDIAPTVLGMLGLPYQAPFFGQDVLHLSPDHAHTLLFSHNHNVAALRGDHLCILGLHKSEQCVSYARLPGAPGPDSTRFARIPPDKSLIDLATAYYQTGYELFESREYR